MRQGSTARAKGFTGVAALFIGLLTLACGMALILGSADVYAQGAQDVIKQIKLSDKLVEGFISAQKDMAAMAEKMQASTPDKPDPAIQTQLEDIAKKHGFASFLEYDDVAANISMVMAGIDPQSGTFTDPVSAIKKEIEELEKDTKIADKDKKQMLEELKEALKSTPPLQHPDNVEIVKKYRTKIEAVLQ